MLDFLTPADKVIMRGQLLGLAAQREHRLAHDCAQLDRASKRRTNSSSASTRCPISINPTSSTRRISAWPFPHGPALNYVGIFEAQGFMLRRGMIVALIDTANCSSCTKQTVVVQHARNRTWSDATLW